MQSLASYSRSTGSRITALITAMIGFVLSFGAHAQSVPSRAVLSADDAAVLHPLERIAYADDWKLSTTRRINKGGYAFVILRTPAGETCVPIHSSTADITLYSFHPTVIDTPSSENGRTGTFYEALLPRNTHTCVLSRFVFVEWKPEEAGVEEIFVGDTSIKVSLEFTGLLTPPKRALVIGLGNYYQIQGHCEEYCQKEAELAQKYGEVLLEHKIQPIQNWIHFPPVIDGYLDLDHNEHLGHSFRQTTMKYRTSELVGFPRSRHYPGNEIQYLQALEATIHREGLAGKAWVYAMDEPERNCDGSLCGGLVSELELYKEYAPSVRVMVTTDYSTHVANAVDIFSPVLNNLLSSDHPSLNDYVDKELWTYVSCMGSCGVNRKVRLNPPRDPGPDTGLPDLLIDRPVERLFQFFTMLENMEVDGALYYEATEGYPLVRKGVNLIEDPWNFGGNGDGLLLYPGRPGEFGFTEHQPIVSFRLKLIRHAIENEW